MTPDQITKIRQNAFEIRSVADNDEPKQTKGEPEACFPRMRRLADEILALLLCETCGGTRTKVISGCWGMVHKEIPCPDCESKSECGCDGCNLPDISREG